MVVQDWDIEKSECCVVMVQIPVLMLSDAKAG